VTDAAESTPTGSTSNSGTDFIRERITADVADGSCGGRVQTRFPPEPNGFLHIGHAKAIALNFGIAEEFDGSCVLRFDDTNPDTEDSRFADAIEDDIGWLGYRPTKVTYASDYFDRLYEWAVHLIEIGLAYVDDQDAGTISANRGGFTEPGVDSPWRDRSIEENLWLFLSMKKGQFAEGEKVLRAKIDMAHDNMAMRDPVMYRIRHSDHFRTGDEWKIYPTYDWAHGQSDALEGTTHSLCTLEFDTHRPLYDWFLTQLGVTEGRPRQTEFARLNLTHTVLSKRKLAQLVSDGLVDGWDDPRMPTLRGLRRRGYPPEAIRAFAAHIGVARVNGTHEIELLESFVRTHHNAHALRRMAVLDPLEVVITNWPDGADDTREAINNPEDDSAGTRDVPFSGRLFIERADFMVDPPKKFYRLAPGREVRLRAGYFITCTDVETDADGEIVRLLCTYDPETAGGQAPDGRKVKATIHWVSADHAVDGTVVLYERLFTDSHPGADGRDPLASLNPDSREIRTGCKLEPALADTPPGEVVQFERLGYFAHDLDEPLVFHRTVGLRDEWANIQKRQKP
jgi:glutaminyl-tRNA synthetase